MLELLENKQYQRIVAKCWADPTFKQKLYADPTNTLRAEGIDVPDGVKIDVVENVEQATIIVIPPRPRTLTDDVLELAKDGGEDMVDYRSYGYSFM